MLLIAQTQPTKANTADALLWIGVLIVLVVIASVVVVAIRRKMLAGDSDAAETITMNDLRAMVQRGQLSQEEYDTMRAAMAKKVKDAALNDPKVQAQLAQLRGAKKVSAAEKPSADHKGKPSSPS